MIAMPADGRIRIATLNVWALPGRFARHTSERMRAIGEHLQEMDVDLLAVQELWTRQSREELFEAAGRAGLREVWHRRAAFGGSGLAILSRIPLRRVRFQPFRLRGLPQRIQHGDYWGGKGFAIATIVTAAGQVAVLDTHLHAQYADDALDDYHAHRVGEMVEIAAALRRVSVPVIALGDFNSREGRPEYEVLKELSGLRDVAVELDRRQPTVLKDQPYRTGEFEPVQRIDYVFVRDGRAARLRAIAIERVFDEPLFFGDEPGAYSDHAGLWTELEVVPAEAPGPPAPGRNALELARAVLEAGLEDAMARQRCQRITAGGGVLAALASAGAAWRMQAGRRGFLSAALRTGGAAFLLGGLGQGLLAEHFTSRELEAFESVLRELNEMELPG